MTFKSFENRSLLTFNSERIDENRGKNDTAFVALYLLQRYVCQGLITLSLERILKSGILIA